MLITWKFPRSIAGCTKHAGGPRVWDSAEEEFEFPWFPLKIDINPTSADSGLSDFSLWPTSRKQKSNISSRMSCCCHALNSNWPFTFHSWSMELASTGLKVSLRKTRPWNMPPRKLTMTTPRFSQVRCLFFLCWTTFSCLPLRDIFFCVSLVAARQYAERPIMVVSEVVNLQWKAGVHNLFVIADRITFVFMNYSRQWVQDIYIFSIVSVLLTHTKPNLLPHVCLAVFLQNILLQ